MKFIWYVASSVMETLLRVLPFPCKTGLVKIGNPGKDSPVFLTCNFQLTVQRIKRALKGLDAYLLIANSRGINVWCGSVGGHFTNHSVISVLKTSEIEKLVSQKVVVLPQLAAAAIEAEVIREKTGWEAIWGPVYAKDIPQFMGNRLKKEPRMREVIFPWTHRLEMAIAWAFPISAVFSLFLIFLWPAGIVPTICLVWGLSFLIFLSFPLYSSLLSSKGKRIGFVFFDFGRGGFQLIVWGILLFGLLTYSVLLSRFSWSFFLRWGFLFFIVVLVLSIDLKGSTPLFKSSLHEERLFRTFLDRKKCQGVGVCEEVCPRNCFKVDKVEGKAKMPGTSRCVACGACIIQCPSDALRFKGPEGREIFPEAVRKLKINLMGKRGVTGFFQ